MPRNRPERTTLAFKRVRWVIVGIAAITIIFGLAVLIGWAARIPALVRLRPGLPPMQFNTGLGFVLAGLALAAWARRRRRVVLPILGGLVALLGGLTLVEYLAGLNLGIDQLCFQSSFFEPGAYPGRMSAVSALCLFLTGIGLVRLGSRHAPHLWLVGTLASVVVSAAFNALLGYVFGLPGAYQWGQINRIAPHTSVGLIILGSGLLIAAWQNGCRPGERSPRWLPVPLALGIFTSALVLFFALDARKTEDMVQTLRLGSDIVQREIKTRVENRAKTLTRMARRWENAGQPLSSTWVFDAGLYTQDFPDVQAVEWIDPSGHIRWIVPVAGNEAKVGLDAAREGRRAEAMERARKEHRAIFSGAVTLFRGGLGAIIYTPIQKEGGKFEGWIAGVFEVQGFLDCYLPTSVAAGQAMRLSDGDQTIYTRAADAPLPPNHPEQIARARIEMPGVSWDLLMWPSPALLERSSSPLPLIVLVVGIIDALLLAGICHIAQRHSRISRARTLIAEAFQLALEEVKTLEGLLPICSCCKRVRDDTGYWNQIDTYLDHHTDAQLSHGYCPECAAKAFTEFGLKIPDRVQAELLARNFE